MPKTIYRKAKPATLCAVCREPSTRTCYLCSRPTCEDHPNCGRHPVEAIDEVRDVEVGPARGKLVARCSQCPRRATRTCEECSAPICGRHNHCADGEPPSAKKKARKAPVLALATRSQAKPEIAKVADRANLEVTRLVSIRQPGDLADRLSKLATVQGASQLAFGNNRWSWNADEIDISVTLTGEHAVVQTRAGKASSLIPLASVLGVGGLFLGPVGITLGALWAFGCVAVGVDVTKRKRPDRQALERLADRIVSQLKRRLIARPARAARRTRPSCSRRVLFRPHRC